MKTLNENIMYYKIGEFLSDGEKYCTVYAVAQNETEAKEKQLTQMQACRSADTPVFKSCGIVEEVPEFTGAGIWNQMLVI